MPRVPADAATPASIVAALKALAGEPPNARTGLVRGQCVRGTYAASDRALEITTSRSFTRPSRVLARFSVGTGNPGMAAIGGLALRGFSFRLGDAAHRTDLLTQNVPLHFARTLDQMLAFLKTRVPRTNGKPDPRKVGAFSAANPETLHQADYIAAHPPPASLAATTFWGVHAFPATNAQGETRFIKFKVVPVGEDIAKAESAARTRTDLLHEDLGKRIAAGHVRFNIMALLDRPGDPVMDTTVRWPDEDQREEVRLGTIVITGIETDDACDALRFDPANLAEGIGYPPDEIFAARRTAYAIATAKRD